MSPQSVPVLRRASLACIVVVALVVALGLAAGPLYAADPEIHFDGSPGTAEPPATLGGYTMTAFANDTRALGIAVTTVPGPTGNLTFSKPLTHSKIDDGWATWSHNYAGDTYDTSYLEGEDEDFVTITLPGNTVAFYFYVEPASYGEFTVTATAQDGTTSGPVSVEGDAGATYFGFYGTDGAMIESVTITVDEGAYGFAVGEFGIAAGQVPPTPTPTPTPPEVPEPGSMLLLASGLAGLGGFGALRARFSRK